MFGKLLVSPFIIWWKKREKTILIYWQTFPDNRQILLMSDKKMYLKLPYRVSFDLDHSQLWYFKYGHAFFASISLQKISSSNWVIKFTSIFSRIWVIFDNDLVSFCNYSPDSCLNEKNIHVSLDIMAVFLQNLKHIISIWIWYRTKWSRIIAIIIILPEVHHFLQLKFRVF